MKARRRPGVRVRTDDFGGICYVPHRDDFFALTHESLTVVKALPDEYADAEPNLVAAFTKLAEVGIAETVGPVIPEQAYTGPSLIGQFPELPSVKHPLVVNCFCTSHCPLKCIYCHADDLMTQDLRDSETERDLDNVLATAASIPAMVAVITGGDPLTKPFRAQRLIEGLATSKALVLDTSGVGSLEDLVPTIKKHSVHVRVSLDAVLREENSKLRPVNRRYVASRFASWEGATRTIETCIAEKIPVTVQTVINSFNEQEDDWRDLREWLARKGVKNWVLHAAVAGGKAREYEMARRTDRRRRPLLPSDDVFRKLWNFVKDTTETRWPIDIRCTDTEQSPNSVLLIGSNGDLYTEGYAKKGKVLLFKADQGRPDRINSLMAHVDRFGHARRYLNWNKWFFEQRSIEELGLRLPAAAAADTPPAMVENELKLNVTNLSRACEALELAGFIRSSSQFQRDEYFDTSEESLRKLDWVVRVRQQGSSTFFAVKGQRFYQSDDSNSRIEIEVPVAERLEVIKALEDSGFTRTWFFEKRRLNYTTAEGSVVVSFDEIPELGWYVELEGPSERIAETLDCLRPSLGHPERRNYKEIFVAYRRALGQDEGTVKGAEFTSAN